VLGFVVELLFVELPGFIPVPLDPGDLDVSVVDPGVGAAGVDPVDGAAGRAVSPLEPVVPVESVEPLPEIEPLLLDESVLVEELPVVAEPLAALPRPPRAPTSVDVECRPVSVVLRPLARRCFIDPCWLQSHLQSLPDESLPIVVPLAAVSRLRVVPVDDIPVPPLRSEVDVVAEPEVDPRSDVLVLLDVLGVVALLDVPGVVALLDVPGVVALLDVPGVALSAGEVVSLLSLLLVLLVELD
jgi:hypothetical protein